MRFARLFCFCLLMTGCLEQFDPSKNNARFQREEAQSRNLPPKLTATGEIPGPGGPAINIDERYQTLCAGCHGAHGQGDGSAGVALTPKPRSFADGAWQATVNDERIAKVIANGGVSVGLSPMMAPWGAVLSEAEIAKMVAKVRSFKP